MPSRPLLAPQFHSNLQSYSNPRAISKSNRDGRTVVPEYIEPGRRPGPNRSPIAAGFRDCAGSGTVQGLEEHKSCSVMEERRRAAFPAPSTTLRSI